MKETLILGVKLKLKDVNNLYEIIKSYEIPAEKEMKLYEYYIESNIPQVQDFKINLRVNDMRVVAINSVDDNAIPIILNEKIKFLFSANQNNIVKIELQQSKLIDVKSIPLIPDSEISDLYLNLYFFGELNDKFYSGENS